MMTTRSNDDGAMMTIRLFDDGAMMTIRLMVRSMMTIRSDDSTTRSNDDGAMIMIRSMMMNDCAIGNVMCLITRWRDDAISVAMQWCD